MSKFIESNVEVLLPVVCVITWCVMSGLMG